MTCEQARERLVDRWITGVDESERIELEQHCAVCDACHEESETLQALWNGLGDLPIEEPGKNLRAGFYQMMDAYRLGQAERPFREAVTPMPPRRQSVGVRPTWMWQAAAAAVILAVGLTAGHFYAARNQDEKTIAKLNTEMQSMKQLVALSLLQQQSASDRLRGVSYSVRMEPPADSEVLSALMQTLKHDQNVNVRLAAVDALKPFASATPIRQGLREAMLTQDSPLVQISLIEWAVDAKDRASLEVLEKLERQSDLHPAVKVRLARALDRLRMQ